MMEGRSRAGTNAPLATESTRPESHEAYRSDIEGMRAIAVLMVVAFHAGIRGLSGGFVGVDVFFAISGYLITKLLADELAASGRISLLRFVARRIRRLLPGASVVLLATLAVSSIVFPPLQMERTAVAARAAAAYAGNVHFLGQASDYFSGDVRLNPMLHTWSLGVEEQFYLVWPLVLIGLAGWRREPGGATRRLAWGLTAIGVFSFLAACWCVRENPSLAFYAMPLRAWEFACGGLASLVAFPSRTGDDRAARPALAIAMGWLGLAMILFAAVSYAPSTEFPGPGAMVPVCGASMILLAGALRPVGDRPGVGAVLGTLPMRWIGRRSYSLYLWHWPIFVLGAAIRPDGGFAFTLGLFLLALILADLTFRIVETPFRATRGTRAHSRHAWRTVGIGAAATAALVLTTEAARRAAITASHGPLQQAITVASHDLGRAYDDGCVNFMGEEQVHVCRYGSPSSKTTIMLFGDSHTVQWLPAIEAVARARGWGVLLIAKTRCATADVPVYIPTTGRRATACERWRRAAMDTIRQRHPAVVLLSNAMCYIRWSGLPAEIPAVSAAEWENGMLGTLTALRESGVQPIVIQATPELHPNVLACLSRSGWVDRRRGACGVDRAIALSSEVADLERRVVAAVAGSHVIDLTDILCQHDACTPMIGDIVANQDGDHLTSRMTRLLAPMFAGVLDSAVAH